MKYKEKDIDQLDLLPKTSKERGYYERYHKSWTKTVNGLDKINPANLVGLSINDIITKYLHRLPEEYKTIKFLLSTLNIHRAILISNSLMFLSYNRYYDLNSYYIKYRNIYYIHPETKIITLKPGITKTNKDRSPKKARMKTFYERKHQQNKKWREYHEQMSIYLDGLLYWTEYNRKKKEEQLNLTKLISKGFDPITSFRNVPKQ